MDPNFPIDSTELQRYHHDNPQRDPSRDTVSYNGARISNVKVYDADSFVGKVKAFFGLATKVGEGDQAWYVNNASLRKHAFTIQKDATGGERGKVTGKEGRSEFEIDNVRVYSSDSIIGRMKSACGLAFKAVDAENNTAYVNKASYEKQPLRKCIALAERLINPANSPKDRYQALGELREMANKDNQEAKELLCVWEDMRPNYQQFGSWVAGNKFDSFVKLAESDPSALYDLGRCLIANRNTDLGVKYIKMAAEKGCIEAKVILANEWMNPGTGAFRDKTGTYQDGLKLMQEAAEGGNQKAQYELGVLYLNGYDKEGIKPDHGLAQKYLTQAAAGAREETTKLANTMLQRIPKSGAAATDSTSSPTTDSSTPSTQPTPAATSSVSAGTGTTSELKESAPTKKTETEEKYDSAVQKLTNNLLYTDAYKEGLKELTELADSGDQNSQIYLADLLFDRYINTNDNVISNDYLVLAAKGSDKALAKKAIDILKTRANSSQDDLSKIHIAQLIDAGLIKSEEGTNPVAHQQLINEGIIKEEETPKAEHYLKLAALSVNQNIADMAKAALKQKKFFF